MTEQSLLKGEENEAHSRANQAHTSTHAHYIKSHNYLIFPAQNNEKARRYYSNLTLFHTFSIGVSKEKRKGVGRY